MSSLVDPNVIDYHLGHPDGPQELVLAIEAGEWDLPEAMRRLQDKLNAYAEYALDGQMFEKCPDARGQPVTIMVVSVDPVPEGAQVFLDRVGQQLRSHGLTLAVTRAPEEQAA